MTRKAQAKPAPAQGGAMKRAYLLAVILALAITLAPLVAVLLKIKR